MPTSGITGTEMRKNKRSATAVIPPCILIVAATYGFARYSFGLFLPEIRQEMGMSIAEAGAVVSVSYLGYLVASAISSIISGRVGPRLPVVLGGILATGGLLAASLAYDRNMLIAGLFAAGMSPGFSYPPLSDAITRLVSAESRDWVYTIVNSGTSIGIIISAPAAIFFVADWRLCLFSFSAFSAIVTVWNWTIIPVGPFVENRIRSRWPITVDWLVNNQSIPLFLSAFLFGVSSAIYWVFATELLTNHSGNSKQFVTMFWLTIGVAGLFGGIVGTVITRAGLARTVFWGLLIYAVSMLLFAIQQYSDGLVFVSAALFGASFISVTGIYGVWSMNVFSERPSVGFGAVFLLISVGQFVAPIAGGYFAHLFGIEMLFVVALLVGLPCLVCLPTNNVPGEIEVG